MFGRARGALCCWIRRFKQSQLSSSSSTHSCFCSSSTSSSSGSGSNKNNKVTENAGLAHYKETYKKLDNLDFMTAANILFTDSPNKKKFGLDFHLVQLFFACLPSLAVYLVAQYARADMKQMDLELEKKRKQEEEEKAKESETNSTVDDKEKSDPELSEVKVRLDKLEEAVKEIAIKSNKQSTSRNTKIQEEVSNKNPATVVQSISASNKSIEKENVGQKKADKSQKDDTHSNQPS